MGGGYLAMMDGGSIRINRHCGDKTARLDIKDTACIQNKMKAAKGGGKAELFYLEASDFDQIISG